MERKRLWIIVGETLTSNKNKDLKHGDSLRPRLCDFVGSIEKLSKNKIKSKNIK